jgi:hypothetical protein
MFEDVRRAFQELLHGNATPDARRAVVAEMRETLVRARLGVDDLRRGADETRRRLESERRELDTVRRRKSLAAGINDAETVTVAERFEQRHAEKVQVLERKLETQQAELAMVEKEVEEMTREYKAAAAGATPGRVPSPEVDVDAALGPEETKLKDTFDSMSRSDRRAAAEADADERLAALKRRMGK